MKTATIRDLRNEFARLSKWIERGETVQLLKRGKPFARMVPEPQPKSFLGYGKGTAKLAPDFGAPLNLEWDAMK